MNRPSFLSIRRSLTPFGLLPWLGITLLFVFPWPGHGALERPPLSLGLGEQRILAVPGLSRYSVGGPAVRATSLKEVVEAGSAPRILVKGVSPGTADLWIWKQDGSSEHRLIQVSKSGAPRIAQVELAPALSLLEEVEVIPLGKGGVLLRGDIRTLEESARIAALARGFPQEVKDETRLLPHVLKEGRERLEAWLEASKNTGRITVEEAHQTLWVRGAIPKASERQALERQIRALFPKAEIELEALPDSSPTVHFRVFLLEIQKSRLGTLGLQWPGLIENAFRISSTGVDSALALDLTLQALENDGSARILSKPELVVRAPGEAELFAGGELPIRTNNRYSAQVLWKSFGLTLRLKVTHSAGNQVRLDISTEVSQLDSTIAQGEIPGIQANRMRTQVDARYGTPLFLSGLLQEGIREQARGLPGLKRIPVLGKLFGSDSYLNHRSELVAILLPNKTLPPPPMKRMGEPERPEPGTPAVPLPASHSPENPLLLGRPRPRLEIPYFQRGLR